MDAYAQALGLKPLSSKPMSGNLSPGEQAKSDAYEARPDQAPTVNDLAAAPPDARADMLRAAAMVRTQANPYGAALGIGVPQPTQQPAQPPVATPQQPAVNQPETSPVFDFVANQITGLGSTAVGGLRGLGTLLTGGTADEAANKVTQTQQDYTFQPRSEGGKAAVEAFGSKYNPLNWPSLAGQYLGGKLADAGLPAAGAVVNAATTVSPMLLTIRGSGGKLQDLNRPRIEPTMDGSATPATPASPSAPAKPSLANASPELQQAAQKAGASANQQVLNNHVLADTLPVPVKLTAGEATGDPNLISMERNGKGKSIPPVSPEFYKENIAALAKNVDAIKDRVAPDIVQSDPTALGQTLVDAYKRKDAPIVAGIDAKYQALRDAAGGEFPVDAKTFVQNADAALKKQLKSEFVPPAIARQLEGFRNGDPMTFEQFEALRTNLAAEARKAQRTGDGNTEYATGVVRSALEDLPLQGGAEALKPLADQARAAAKARFDAIKADPAYKAAVNDTVAEGQPSPLADRFATGQVVNGRHANVLKMSENLSADPLARQAMAAAVMEHLRTASKADSQAAQFTQDGLNRAIKALGPKLDTTLGDQAAVVRQLGEVARLKQNQPAGSYVNNSFSLVAGIAEAAKGGLEGTLNLKSGGVPVGSWIRQAAQRAEARKLQEQSTEVGAGLTYRLSDMPGVQKSRVEPH